MIQQDPRAGQHVYYYPTDIDSTTLSDKLFIVRVTLSMPYTALLVVWSGPYMQDDTDRTPLPGVLIVAMPS